MTLVLWRHGQTDYNLEGRIQGRVDIPLNDVGRDQAASAAPDLVALNPAVIFSSPWSGLDRPPRCWPRPLAWACMSIIVLLRGPSADGKG